MRDGLQHVYWLGGGSRAGKTTIARRIADQHGFRIYSTDDAMKAHASRSSRIEHPLLANFLEMDMDDRWVNRSPQRMLETFPWFQGECFEMIVEDLLQLPIDKPILAEGFRLLPNLVKPLLSSPGHAVWLLPTSEFRAYAVEKSGGDRWQFLAKTADPGKARNNLYERDRLFTDCLSADTLRLSLKSVTVDLDVPEDSVLAHVSACLGL